MDETITLDSNGTYICSIPSIDDDRPNLTYEAALGPFMSTFDIPPEEYYDCPY